VDGSFGFLLAVQTNWAAIFVGKKALEGDEMQNYESLETVSVEEAGKILGIGRVLAYRLAKSGQIPVLRLGQRRFRIPLAALEAWLKNPDGFSV